MVANISNPTRFWGDCDIFLTCLKWKARHGHNGYSHACFQKMLQMSNVHHKENKHYACYLYLLIIQKVFQK